MPSKETMAKAKVLRSPLLVMIIEEMEDGSVIRYSNMRKVIVDEFGFETHISKQNVKTLKDSKLIASFGDFDDYIEYRLTYDPKITSIKDVK